MLRFAIALSCLFSLFAFASQAQSRCDQARDPHSFACAEDTFVGRIFPLFQMNGSPQAVFDSWQILTYADVSGTPGPEFSVLTNPQNPRIPEGIVNTADGSEVGILNWNSSQVSIASFGAQGRNFLNIPGRTVLRDNQTIETVMARGSGQQAFQCRMFLRQNTDHLLCRWFSLSGNAFVFRGYLGFLRVR